MHKKGREKTRSDLSKAASQTASALSANQSRLGTSMCNRKSDTDTPASLARASSNTASKYKVISTMLKAMLRNRE